MNTKCWACSWFNTMRNAASSFFILMREYDCTRCPLPLSTLHMKAGSENEGNQYLLWGRVTACGYYKLFMLLWLQYILATCTVVFAIVKTIVFSLSTCRFLSPIWSSIIHCWWSWWHCFDHNCCWQAITLNKRWCCTVLHNEWHCYL